MSQKVGRKLNVHHTREACNGPSRAGTIVSQSHSLTQAPHIKVYGLYSVEGQINWKTRFHPSILFLPPLSLKGLNGGCCWVAAGLVKALPSSAAHSGCNFQENGQKETSPCPQLMSLSGFGVWDGGIERQTPAALCQSMHSARHRFPG